MSPGTRSSTVQRPPVRDLPAGGHRLDSDPGSWRGDSGASAGTDGGGAEADREGRLPGEDGSWAVQDPGSGAPDAWPVPAEVAVEDQDRSIRPERFGAEGQKVLKRDGFQAVQCES